MVFDLKNSGIYKAVTFCKIFSPPSLRFFRYLFLIFGIISYVVFIASAMILPRFNFNFWGNDIFHGLYYIFIAFGLLFYFWEIYFRSYLVQPQPKSRENLAEFLSLDAAIILEKISGLPSADELLLALAREKREKSTFARIGVDPKSIIEVLEKDAGDQGEDLMGLIVEANNIRLSRNGEKITSCDLLAALFDFNPFFRRIVIDRGLDKDDLKMLGIWHESNETAIEKSKKFWSRENQLRKSPVGIDWTYGYSQLLRKYTHDLTRHSKQALTDLNLMSRNRIIEAMENVLIKDGRNNILLIGEPGVGKKTIINNFAKMVSEGKALPGLNFKRVLELNMAAVLSSSKNPNEIRALLVALLNEAVKAGNIIINILDFHNYIGGSDSIGNMDVSQVMLPYFESASVQIIVSTDPLNYHKYIEPRAEILKVFEKIEIQEPGIEETTKIILELLPAAERRSGVVFSYGAVKDIIVSADRYIHSSPFPEKAVELLTEVAGYAKSRSKTFIMPDDVNDVVSLKTQIPVGKMSGSEREKLLNLEAEMSKEIIGQSEAVRVVSQTMQRLRTDVVKRNKPAGVFLFAGPTGVGKTQTAKILAKTFYGSPDRMLRFDMGEYQDAQSLDRFIGSLRLNEPGQFASRVRDNPFSLILLDEIEKADKNILNVFLRIFDEGEMTDVFGRKVSFKQNIIIATSNAGADYIRESVMQGIDPSKQKEDIINILVSKKYFSPELLNRFDEIVIFHPLGREQLVKISELMINSLAERLRQQGYLFQPTAEVVEYIARIGFDPQFGARPMQRQIQDKIENVIARKILEGTITKGATFSLTLQEIEG